MKKILIGATAGVAVALSLSAYAHESLQGSESLNAVSAVIASSDDGTDGTETEIKWLEVELATPGTLGVEVLYKVDVLNDIDYLKVKGTMNSTDWTTINNMKNVQGLDLSQAKFDAVPDEGFRGLSKLYTVKLPEGVTSIGWSAFLETNLQSIDIPATVATIGDDVFRGLKSLETITFAKNSVLTAIPHGFCNSCYALKSITIPNTVVSIGNYAFYDCQSLSNCVLPLSLQSIGGSAFYNTKSLKNIDFPQGLKSIGGGTFGQSGLENVCLPIGLTVLGGRAFGYCYDLKYVELPSYVERLEYTFFNCNAIEKIVCRSATPPVIYEDPFRDANKSNVTLVVPSFALVDYKLDTYWLQFGNIIAGDDIDYWKVTSSLLLTNDRRMNGKPDIDLWYGGKLMVGGNAPMEVGNLNIYVNGENPGQLYNLCNAMKADAVSTIYTVSANRWYFITPMHDVNLADIRHSQDASFVFRYYDCKNRADNGVGESWKDVTDNVLKAGQGYIFQCNENGTITLPATADGVKQLVAAGDVTTKLAAYASENDADMNWNYVGNPYPCYYDSYYMDFTAPITVWDMNEWTYKAYSIVDDNFVLSPMQAFFVQKPDGVDEILFHKDGCQFENTVNRVSPAPAKARVNSNRSIFNIKISGNGLHDETRVVINDEALMSYELTCDAAKFMSINADVPQIYTIDNEGNILAINERPMDNGVVKVGVYTGASGYYTIECGNVSGDVELHDAVTGQTVTLNDNGYTFYTDETGTDEARFTLMLKSATSVDKISADGVSIVSVAGGLEVAAPANTEVKVYGIGGNLVKTVTTAASSTRIQLANGVYIVNVNGKSVKCVVL